MIVLDTGLVVCLVKGDLAVADLPEGDIAYASLSLVEALGHPSVTAVQQVFLGSLFEQWSQLPIDPPVLITAIRLQQRARCSLVDALVAATALTYEAGLWTADPAAYRRIEGLRLHDPIASHRLPRAGRHGPAKRPISL